MSAIHGLVVDAQDRMTGNEQSRADPLAVEHVRPFESRNLSAAKACVDG